MAGWLRLYTEIRHDRKLKRVSPGQRWLWIVIMTIAAESPDPGWLLLSQGVPLTVEELADEATMPVEDASSCIQVFIKLRMLEYVDGVYHLVNWDKRQFKSDNSTDRWRRWNDRQQSAQKSAQPLGQEQLSKLPEQQDQPDQLNQPDQADQLDQPFNRKSKKLGKEQNEGQEELKVEQISQQRAQHFSPTFTNVGPTPPDTDTDTDSDTENNYDDDGAPARENFVTTFGEEFGRLISLSELKALKHYAQTQEGEALVCEAIRRTRAQGKASVRYVTAILQNWRGQGVVCLTDVVRADQEFAIRQQAKIRGKSPPEKRPLSPENALKKSMIRDLYRN